MEQLCEQAKRGLERHIDQYGSVLQRLLDGCISLEDAQTERQKIMDEVESVSIIATEMLKNMLQESHNEQERLEQQHWEQQIQSCLNTAQEMGQVCLEAMRGKEEAKRLEPKGPVILGNSQSSDNTITPIVLDEEVTSIDVVQLPAVVPIGPSPVGLDNLMQWCHYNAIMQCMCHLPPVSAYAKLHTPLHHNTHCTDLPCSLCHLHTFLHHYAAQVQLYTHPAINPTLINTALTSINLPGDKNANPELPMVEPTGLSSGINGTGMYTPSSALRAAHNALLCHMSARSGERLMIAEQQDCHETWQTLVHCCAVDHFRACGVSGGNEVAGGKRTSPLQQVFTGILQSCLRCSECGRASYTTETFSSLALQVHSDDIQDLPTAVVRFTAEEGGVDYACEACQTASAAATKKLDFLQLPAALVIQLARFRDQHSKIGKHVSFQERLTLPLSSGEKARVDKHQHGEDADVTGKLIGYTLCGVVEHLGQSLHFGHYRAFVRAPSNQHNTWFEVNDTEVIAKTCFEEVASVDAYLLFYCRDDAQDGSLAENGAAEQDEMDLGDAMVPVAPQGNDRPKQGANVRGALPNEPVNKKPRASLEMDEGAMPCPAPIQCEFDAMLVPDVAWPPSARCV